MTFRLLASFLILAVAFACSACGNKEIQLPDKNKSATLQPGDIKPAAPVTPALPKNPGK
jgi:predicted small lipoprotein YifL